MAETQPESQPQTQAKPALTVLSQYIKDLSFENPNAPGILTEMAQNQPQMNINLNVTNRMIDAEQYEVVLSLKTKADVGEKVGFVAELDYAASVRITEGLKPEIKEILLAVQVPQLLFPFARQLLSETTSQAGSPPLLINPVDFQGMLIRAKQQAAAQKEAEKETDPEAVAQGDA